MSSVLTPTGTITIVTDNQAYASVLARAISKRSDLAGRSLLSHSESQATQATFGTVDVFVGRPGAECGHHEQASSYFDRLWNKGQKKKRFTIFVGLADELPLSVQPKHVKKRVAN